MAKLIALLVQGLLFSAINKVYAKDVRSVRRRTFETVFHGPLLGVSAKELSPETKSLEYELQELLDQRNNEHSAQEPRNENRKLCKSLEYGSFDMVYARLVTRTNSNA